MTLFWSSEATGDGRSVLLFLLWSLHLRQAPNTKKVRMKKQGSVSNPKLPTWSPWPWFIHLDKNLVGTRHFLMFWGCSNIRVVHGFFANVAEPLGYVKHRVDQSSPWFSGFLQQAQHCSQLQGVLTWASTQDPSRGMLWLETPVVPGRGKGQKHRRCSSLFKINDMSSQSEE